MGERVWWRRLEWGLLIAGLILTGSYLTVRVHRHISAHLALRKFEAERREARFRAQESAKERTGEQVDFSLWSDKRVHEYMESLVTRGGTPSAVLSHSEVEPGGAGLRRNRRFDAQPGCGKDHRHGEIRRGREYRDCGTPRRILPWTEGYCAGRQNRFGVDKPDKPLRRRKRFRLPLQTTSAFCVPRLRLL